MDWLVFSTLSIGAFTQFLLALLITVYLITVRNKAYSTRMLVLFFGAYTLSLLAYFLLFSVNAVWRSYMGYAQAVFLYLSVIAMLQFAYCFPEGRYCKESRIAFGIFCVVSLGMTGKLFYMLYNQAAEPVNLIVASLVFLLEVIWVIVVLLRKTVNFSNVDAVQLKTFGGRWRRVFFILCRPQGREARALRAFALMMAAWLLLSGSSFLESLGSISVNTLLALLSIGNLLFLFCFVLVYINNTSDPSSFMIKLVGISQVTMLLMMGAMGVFMVRTVEQNYVNERLDELGLCRKALIEENFSDIPRIVDHIDGYALPPLEAERREMFARPGRGRSPFYYGFVSRIFTPRVVAFYRQNPNVDLHEAKLLATLQINRFDMIRLQQVYQYAGMIPDMGYSIYYFTLGDYLFEVCYDHSHYQAYIHRHVALLIYFICGATVLILAFFPMFFRSSLAIPLESLLSGVRRVNEGDLNVVVPVHVEDEIGYVSRSFNHMVESIREANRKLKSYADDLEVSNEMLEQRVAERTQDLNEKNIALETALRELHEAQDQLVMQEKMASLGHLVAGIAHELNSPVGAVGSSADVSNRSIKRLDEELLESRSIEVLKKSQTFRRTLQILKDNNDVILSAADRISKIMLSLRNFVQLDEAEFQMADVHEGLESTLDLLQYEMPDGINVLRIFGDLPPVYCSPGRLNQVFMNVLKNALQAMAEQGELEIETFQENKNVYVRVSDTGVGITPEQLDHIFEFGFKQNRSRVKMGSGLFTAHRIIQEHEGEIKIESKVGEGTQVTIVIPQRMSS